MDNILFSFNGVFPLVLIVGLGIFLRKIQMFDDHFISQANQFCFMVAFPLQLFNNIYHIDYEQSIPVDMLIFIALSILVMTVLLMLIVPRTIKDRTKWGSFIQGAFRSNFLLVGLPLANNLFGARGVVVASIALPVVIPLYNFLAVLVLSINSNTQHTSENKVHYCQVALNILKNPLIIGALSALVLGTLQVPMPLFLDRSIKDVGSIATPLALILLGAQFKFSDLRGRIKLAVIASLLRVVILPWTVIGAAIALGFRGEPLGTIFIVFAAPSAISGYIMAKNMGNDGPLAGQVIILTTLLSVLTMFLGVIFLKGAKLI